MTTEQPTLSFVQDEMARLHDLAEVGWMAAAELHGDERAALRTLMNMISDGLTAQIEALDKIKEAA